MISDPSSVDSRSGLPPLQLFNISGSVIPLDESEFRKILTLVEAGERVRFSLLELVFVDEEEIRRINMDFLKRDYVTDIISFRYDSDAFDNKTADRTVEKKYVSMDSVIEGTLYCCAQRIDEQSKEFQTNPSDEFRRIFIHGLLHLVGYDDRTAEGKKEMTSLENEYLDRSRTGL